MRSNGIVMLPPALDQHLRLAKRGEDFHIEQFVAQLGIEALIVSVLPRTARLDIECSHADPAEPRAYCLGPEFAAIVRSDMLGRSVDGEQIREAMQDIVRVQLAGDDDCQTLASELVDYSQHAEFAPILSAIFDKIIGPDMSGTLGSKADTGSVIQPEPPALWLSLWHFQPLAPPDAVNPFQVYLPALRAQKSAHPPIAVTRRSSRNVA